jgi:hypothetical protein
MVTLKLTIDRLPYFDRLSMTACHPEPVEGGQDYAKVSLLMGPWYHNVWKIKGGENQNAEFLPTGPDWKNPGYRQKNQTDSLDFC